MKWNLIPSNMTGQTWRRLVFGMCSVALTCYLFVVLAGSSRIRFLYRQLTSEKCSNMTSLSDRESVNVEECVSQFNIFRYQTINNAAMERVRVENHSYLNAKSLVLEVGGYTGEDASKLIAKYNPYYMAMEPVPRYYMQLEKRYKDNPKFKVLKFGLGKKDMILSINVDTVATSLFSEKNPTGDTVKEEAHIREINMFFDNLDVRSRPIDLISINCEGCEYDLLYLLITSGAVKYLKNIQFQFHLDLPGIANQECRYCSIMELLARTHKPSFQYKYVWQCWKLKG